MRGRSKPLSSILYLLSSLCLFAGGCGSPSRANIELRKKVQSLEDEVATLKQENQAKGQMIAGLQNTRPTVPSLPPPELSKLYVAYGIQFARLTGGVDLDPQKPGDEGIRIYASPVDQNGAVIQAAGSFVIEAYDLDLPGDNRIGRWEFPTLEAKKQWRALLLEAAYVLTCPWQTAPTHPNLTVKMTFTDELTHASYTNQKVIHVSLPPARAPTTAQAGR